VLRRGRNPVGHDGLATSLTLGWCGWWVDDHNRVMPEAIIPAWKALGPSKFKKVCIVRGGYTESHEKTFPAKRSFGSVALTAVLAAGLAGCSSIPSNTPVLLDKTSERIETRSEVISKTLRSVLDEATFVKADIEAVRTSLQSLDATKLTDKDKRVVADSVATLTQLELTLGKTKDFSPVPEESSRIFRESANSIRLVRQIIASEVDKKALVQDMIDAIEKTKGKVDKK